MEGPRITQTPPEEAPRMSAGQAFVKKIKPIGCVMFLLFFALFLLYCFLPRDSSVPGYAAPHDSTYYAQSAETLGELQTELETNLLPKLDGVVSCEMGDGVIVITTEPSAFAAVRNAVLHYYDAGFFSFQTTSLRAGFG